MATDKGDTEDACVVNVALTAHHKHVSKGTGVALPTQASNEVVAVASITSANVVQDSVSASADTDSGMHRDSSKHAKVSGMPSQMYPLIAGITTTTTFNQPGLTQT